MSWFTSIFKSKRHKELEQEIQQLREDHAALTQAHNELLAAQRDPEDVQPWFELKTGELHPVHGLQVELDWNPAFIQYLKDNGTLGSSAESMIQKWIVMLYENLITDLEEQVIQNNSIVAGKEYA